MNTDKRTIKLEVTQQQAGWLFNSLQHRLEIEQSIEGPDRNPRDIALLKDLIAQLDKQDEPRGCALRIS